MVVGFLFVSKKEENEKGVTLMWGKPVGRKNGQQRHPERAYGVQCSIYVVLTVLSGLGAIGRMADIPQNTDSCPANAKVTPGLPRMNYCKRVFCKEGLVYLCGGDIWLLSAQHLSSTIFGLRNTNLLNPQ